MKHLLRAGAGMLALVLSVPAAAQYATCFTHDAAGNCVPGHAVVVGPATSTPLTGAVTSTAATPTSGACAFAAGTAACGPFAGQLGLPVRLVLKGGASFTGYVGTTTGSDCAGVNQLTAGGQPIAYAGSVDEYVDLPPTTGGVKHCLVLTVASGTETYAVRQ